LAEECQERREGVAVSARQVMETIYGKLHKYEIVKSPGGLLTSTTFSIYRDGQYYRGSYSSLSAAVEAAKKAK
jgi:hypothetical protein